MCIFDVVCDSVFGSLSFSTTNTNYDTKSKEQPMRKQQQQQHHQLHTTNNLSIHRKYKHSTLSLTNTNERAYETIHTSNIIEKRHGKDVERKTTTKTHLEPALAIDSLLNGFFSAVFLDENKKKRII